METKKNRAIFFKNTVQWLQSGSFIYVNFFLFVLALLSIPLASISRASESLPGRVILYYSCFILVIYTLYIAMREGEKMRTEQRNHTWEYFLITQIRESDIIHNTVSCAFLQFLFGYFIFFPFMFMSIFMEGADSIIFLKSWIVIFSLAYLITNIIIPNYFISDVTIGKPVLAIIQLSVLFVIMIPTIFLLHGIFSLIFLIIEAMMESRYADIYFTALFGIFITSHIKIISFIVRSCNEIAPAFSCKKIRLFGFLKKLQEVKTI